MATGRQRTRPRAPRASGPARLRRRARVGVRALGRNRKPRRTGGGDRSDRPDRARGAARSMSTGWEAVHLDGLDAIPVAGVVWHPVRRRLGIRAFGINAYSA